MRWMFFGFSDFQENNVWHRSIVHNITFVFLNSGSVKSNQSILNHCLLLHAIRKTVLFGYPWKALQSLVCFKAEGGESGGHLHRLFLDTRNGPTTVSSVSGFVWFSAHLVSFRERERELINQWECRIVIWTNASHDLWPRVSQMAYMHYFCRQTAARKESAICLMWLLRVQLDCKHGMFSQDGSSGAELVEPSKW